MENEILKPSFDVSKLFLLPSTDNKKAEKRGPAINKKLSKIHAERFDDLMKELEKDFKKTGLKLTFSSSILISQVVMNMILLEKVLLQAQILPFLYVNGKDIILLKENPMLSKYTPMNKEYNLHPFFEKMIFRLQNQINDGLKKLGLLPMQQIEKQKLTIIKKLRQKFEQIDKEYSIKAEKEVLTPKKKDPEISKKKVSVEAE